MENYIVEMKDIAKSFYGVKVLNKAQLKVKHGEVHVLLGENGAGKSTLIKILSGAYKVEQGEIYLDGKALKAKNPKEVIDSGISVIYQEFNLVPELPIYENIFIGKEYIKRKLIDKSKTIREAQKYMNMVGLPVSPKTLVKDLSVAQKQLVEIAKAISCNLKVLILDEPTSAITDNETQILFKIINNLKEKGIGIIYISHRMSELFEIGDRCTIMRDGEYIQTIDLTQSNEAELTTLMVGRKIDVTKKLSKTVNYKEKVLEIKNLYYKEFLQDISFDLYNGEILGISGLMGAGRTELAKCIIGTYRIRKGTMKFKGESCKNDIISSLKKGIVYLSEDRKNEGLILQHSLQDNIALPNLSKISKGLLSKKKIGKIADKYINDLKIKTFDNNTIVENLSGGNQQKVVISKWLESDANIYIFDEPTRGIDVGARSDIYKIMEELTKKGKSIILISSDLTEVLRMADRVVVMCEGKISDTLVNDGNLSQEQLLTCALDLRRVNYA